MNGKQYTYVLSEAETELLSELNAVQKSIEVWVYYPHGNGTLSMALHSNGKWYEIYQEYEAMIYEEECAQLHVCRREGDYTGNTVPFKPTVLLKGGDSAWQYIQRIDPPYTIQIIRDYFERIDTIDAMQNIYLKVDVAIAVGSEISCIVAQVKDNDPNLIKYGTHIDCLDDEKTLWRMKCDDEILLMQNFVRTRRVL